jgi:S4 RNA-binding domain protein
MIDIAQRAIERNSMLEIQIRETDEFIKLGQALKKAGLVESGVDAKFVIQDGLVKVNGETELQRGKKIHDGDVISYNGETVKVSK